ncbi:septum formation initiator family protein [Patescibacteria group bacterium]|nr:septum formation initiator family protein [Patescibacteria group bacterium]
MTKIIYHPFIIIIFTITSIVFFLSLNKSSQKTDISSKNIEILEQELNKMSIETSQLEEKIIDADSEVYKEKVIRNELLLQKPGEKIIQLLYIENQENPEIDPVETDKPFDMWLDLIF